MPESLSELVDSTQFLNNTAALRERAEEDSYLFFRGLLPVEPILETRLALLEVLEAHSLLKHPANDLDGSLHVDKLNQYDAEQMRTDIGVTYEIYLQIQKLPAVHRLPHHPNLIKLFETLFESRVLVHPRHIVRMVTPHHAMTPTPVHQDFPLIQGTSNTWTCWFPIGDCPLDMGGLTVLRESHKLGCLPIQPESGAGGIAAQLCPGEDDWASTDYRCGDVLIFPSFTAHKAIASKVRDQVRLSFDVRYQSVNEDVELRSLEPHIEATWQEIYADWEGDQDLQYYWREFDMEITPYDDSLRQPSRRIC